MEKFYLVRSTNTYQHQMEDAPLQGKTTEIEVAKQNAIALATKFRKPYCVYEVILVGKAVVQEATWTEGEL